MDRTTLVRRAIWLSIASIVVNAVTGGIAVVVAASSGSLVLLGFAFDAVIDSAASVALVWRFRIEGSEPDRAARVERTAETVIGAILLVLAGYLVVMSVRALLLGSRPEPTTIGSALLLVSILLLPPLARAKFVTAKRLGSGALRADSLLTAMTSVLALIALVGLVLSGSLAVHWADAVGALVVALVLAREGRAAFGARTRPA